VKVNGEKPVFPMGNFRGSPFKIRSMPNMAFSQICRKESAVHTDCSYAIYMIHGIYPVGRVPYKKERYLIVEEQEKGGPRR
jgi:hypothetical protein